jgi:hypothetical protein
MKLRHLFGTATIGVGLSLLVLIFSQLSSPAQEPLINQKVVNFCNEHIGQKVGNGNCYALAHWALIVAGAKHNLGDYPSKGDYIWGDLVYYFEKDGAATNSFGKSESILPGDVIQFRDCRFGGKGWRQGFEHHTAIVVAVKNGGKALNIAQQAYNGKNIVTTLTVHPWALEKGWFRVYRPVQEETTKKHK